MVSIPSLWLPILLSAILVFAASTLIHMVLGYHRTDYARLPAEDEVRAVLRKADPAPGSYLVPYAASRQEAKDPAFVRKMREGPVMFLTVLPSGPPAMGPRLAWWFAYTVVVSVLAAYVAGRALPAGAPYLSVFRFAGTTAAVAYTVALWHDTIWFGRPWRVTVKHTIGGLIYGVLTAGTFGWLWPR